jgi:ribosomal protein L30E
VAISDIEHAIRTGGLVIGYKQVIKGLHSGLIKEVLVSSNGKSFLESIKLVSSNVPVKLLVESSKELGIMCKKPFNITILGLMEGKGVTKTEKKEVKSKSVEKSKKETTTKKTTKKSEKK